MTHVVVQESPDAAYIAEFEVETPTQGFNVCTHGHPAIKHYTEVAYTPCWTDGLVNLK